MTEDELAEVADELLDSIEAYPAIAEMTDSEPEPTRKVKLVSTERSAPKNAKQEQYIFLANQMVENFKIIRKAMNADSQRTADSDPRRTPR